MPEKYTCRVTYSTKAMHMPFSGRLTVSPADGFFTLERQGNYVDETYKPSEFRGFPAKPKNSTATQFDITFKDYDTRMALHLKFLDSHTLQLAYSNLMMLFESKGVFLEKAINKNKGMLQSNSSGGSSMSPIISDLSLHYSHSPGAYPAKRKIDAVSSPLAPIHNENLSFSSAPKKPQLTSLVSSQSAMERIYSHATSSSEVRPSQSSTLIRFNQTDSSILHPHSFTTSPITSRGSRTFSGPEITPRIILGQSQRRVRLESGSPTKKAVKEDDLLILDGSEDNLSKKKSNSNAVKCFRDRAFNKQWRYRSFDNTFNSCYMNSVLQVLFYSSGLDARLERLSQSVEFRDSSELLRALFTLGGRMREIQHKWLASDGRLYLKETLRDIREYAGVFLDPEFATLKQQDAHELWTKLLDYINESIDKYHMGHYGGEENENEATSQSPSSTTRTKAITANPADFNHLSSPGGLFRIQMLSMLGCSDCSTVKKAQTEDLYDMKLDISDNAPSVESVADLVKKYLAMEVLEYTCENCRSTNANKTQAVKVFPKYLMCVIKRYRYHKGAQEKKITPIIVDREIFLRDIHIDSDAKRRERENLCKAPVFLSVSMPKTPLKEVINTQNTSLKRASSNNSNSLELKSSPIKRKASGDYDSECEIVPDQDYATDLNENDVNLAKSDEEIGDGWSPISNQLNVSPLSNEETARICSHGDYESEPVIIHEVSSCDASALYFKPITFALLDRIRRDYGMPEFSISRSKTWSETMFSPECELPANEVPELYSVDGDGNCLFRSLSWWLWNGDDTHYDQIRQCVVNFIEDFPDEFIGLLADGETIEDHIRNMRNDFEWGSHVEISAAATMLGCPIYTYLENAWKKFRPRFTAAYDEVRNGYIKTSPACPIHDTVASGAIYLSNADGCHYDPVIGNNILRIVESLDPPMPVYSYVEKDGPVYTLTGVVNHIGTSMTCGHYTAITYDEVRGVWLKCDDSYISVISEEKVLDEAGRNGYMLVYKKRDVGDDVDFTHSSEYLKPSI